MYYNNSRILTGAFGNNAFSYEHRKLETPGYAPHLHIPSLKTGDLIDVQIGEKKVFEEYENGKLHSCLGLNHFIRLHPLYPDSPEIIIFDNHNHALYFWIEALRTGIIQKGCELFHIDEHSDLWHNEFSLDLDRAIRENDYAGEFVNLSCNVGNYIEPAIKSGLIGSIIRIENEYQMDQYQKIIPSKNSILNLDLDIFAPEMDFIDREKKKSIIKHLSRHVAYITIATSPYFIDQKRAIEALREIYTEMSSSGSSSE